MSEGAQRGSSQHQRAEEHLHCQRQGGAHGLQQASSKPPQEEDMTLTLATLARIYDPDTRDSVASHISIFESVYRLVNAGAGEELFDRICAEVLTDRCKAICGFLRQRLDAECGTFLSSFTYCGRNYKKSTDISQPLLRYLETMELKRHLQTDFATEAVDLYHENVIRDERVHAKLKQSMKEAAARPLSADPADLMCITQGLHRFNPRYLDDLPELRRRFVVREPGYVNPGCMLQFNAIEREAMAEVERAYEMLGEPGASSDPAFRASNGFPSVPGKRTHNDDDESEEEQEQEQDKQDKQQEEEGRAVEMGPQQRQQLNSAERSDEGGTKMEDLKVQEDGSALEDNSNSNSRSSIVPNTASRRRGGGGGGGGGNGRSSANAKR